MKCWKIWENLGRLPKTDRKNRQENFGFLETDRKNPTGKFENSINPQENLAFPITHRKIHISKIPIRLYPQEKFQKRLTHPVSTLASDLLCIVKRMVKCTFKSAGLQLHCIYMLTGVVGACYLFTIYVKRLHNIYS